MLPLTHLFDQFLRERRYLKNVTSKTEDWYRSAFDALTRTVQIATPADLNKAALTSFVVGLRERGLSPVTCNTWAKALNAFFTWLREEGHVAESLRIQPQRTEKRILQTLTEEQLRRLAWLVAKVDPRECAGPPVHFGLRPTPERMTYIWPGADHPRFFYYQSGHWTQALASLYDLTKDPRYRQRADAMVSYLCGNNPWQVRLFNELGGVYNWTDDTNRDGLQDELRQDMYPESTAFCQIGVMRLWQAIRQ